MAYIHKITAYIVDIDEIYKSGEDWVIDALNATDDIYCPVPVDSQTVELEWNDNLPINLVGCIKEECEKYFKGE